jgi:hypothetical protein
MEQETDWALWTRETLFTNLGGTEPNASYILLLTTQTLSRISFIFLALCAYKLSQKYFSF